MCACFELHPGWYDTPVLPSGERGVAHTRLRQAQLSGNREHGFSGYHKLSQWTPSIGMVSSSIDCDLMTSVAGVA